MSVLLSKILSTVVHPLNFTLYAWIGFGLLALLGFRRLAILGCALATGWLLFWSTPYTAEPIVSAWEQRYPPNLVELAPKADAILVLGGGIKGRAIPVRPEPDLGDAADRVWAGARLYLAGKADHIIVSGGQLPWYGDTTSEADGMQTFLADLGVPPDAITLESDSQTTYENAINSRPLLMEMNAKRVLLVTSAFHMQRSMAVHQRQMPEIEWLPFSTDIQVVPRANSLLQFLPQISVLEQSQAYLREQVGIWMYARRNWL